MADTIGDVLGRGYQVGRGIGRDFSQMRFSRRQEKIRQQYEELAKQHDGVLPPDAVAQMEADLEEAYTQTGGRKRGLTDRDGQTLAQTANTGMQDRARRLGYASAANAAIEGRNDEAFTRAGRTELAQGNFAGGMEGLMSGQIVRDTTAGIGGGLQVGTDAQGNPMRGIDEVGTKHRLSNTAARYGKPESAIQLSRGAEASRLDVLSAIAGRMQILATQPHSAARYDQIKGLWEGVKQWSPEFSHLNIEPGEDMIAVYEGEPGPDATAIDSFTYDKLPELLETVMADPRSVVQNVMDARRGAAAHDQSRREGRQDRVLEAYLTGAQEARKDGKELLAKVLEGSAEARSQGWKQLNTNAEDGSHTMQGPNGQVVVFHPNVSAEGQPLPGFRFTDEDGNEVDQRTMQEVQAVYGDTLAAMAQLQAAGQENDWRTFVQRIAAVDDSGIRMPSAGAGGDRYQQLRDAVEKAESDNNPDAVSSAGAVGRMQTMPATLAKPGYGITPARDNSDAERTRVGNEYLQAMLNEFGDERVALAAYNWGPGAVEKALAANGGDVEAMLASAPAETRNYVAKVLGFAGAAPATQTAQVPATTPPATPPSTGIPTEMTAGRASVSRVEPDVAALRVQLEQAQRTAQAWDRELASAPRTGALGERESFGVLARPARGPQGEDVARRLATQKRDEAARAARMLERRIAQLEGTQRRTAAMSTGQAQFDEMAARILQNQGGAGGQ